MVFVKTLLRVSTDAVNNGVVYGRRAGAAHVM